MIHDSDKASKLPERYLELVREFALRPLHGRRDYRRATQILDRLAAQEEGSLSKAEQDYLDTLCLLVEEYDQRDPVDTSQVTPLDVLKHLMEENGMNTTALGNLLGSKSSASAILHGKRSLSKTHIAKLAERFRVDEIGRAHV